MDDDVSHNGSDEDDVTWLTTLYREIAGLVAKGFDGTQVLLCDVARECTEFTLDVGGVVVADVVSKVKALAQNMGIGVSWVMPTLAEIALTIDDIFAKKRQAVYVRTDSF